MSSRDFGLGPKWWQKPGNKLQKCSERKSEWCDPTETDGCCAVIPCMYCLELEIYGVGTQYGEAEFSETGWLGSVGGGSFFGFWEVGYESGECEFVVHWNGEEVYRKGCADGQSCRDSSDETAVVVDYEDATLRWVKHDYRPLMYVKDPDTNCTIHFCGDCECTCECLCVALVMENGTRYREEFCDFAYGPCLAPVWAGAIGGKEVSITLRRDSYTGGCLVVLVVDGEEYDPIEIVDCKTLNGSLVLPDYSELSFSCKICNCDEPVLYPCECRWDILAIFFSEITTSSGSPCELEPGGSLESDPATNQAWNELDCHYTIDFRHTLTAFPPDCTSIDPNILRKRVVFARKENNETNPFRDDSILSQYDWYAVVYNVTDDTILGVFYEYELCCHNDTPENAATSHLAWVKFFNVALGATLYTLTGYNVTTAAEYGDCGYPPPF